MPGTNIELVKLNQDHHSQKSLFSGQIFTGMLKLPNFGNMITSTILFESHGKNLLMTS